MMSWMLLDNPNISKTKDYNLYEGKTKIIVLNAST